LQSIAGAAMPDFESRPYDGRHPLENPGNDWRGSSGIPGIIERLVSYGNWAGPGNRALVENRDRITAEKRADPRYDEATDPAITANPRYLPIDGIDAAAKKHDSGYSHDLGNTSMFGWQGIRNVREDDRALVAATEAEMTQNGDKYSDGAKSYSEGLRGFFGSRVMGMDAIDWAGNKAGEAWQGLSQFGDEMGQWGSLGDAGRGIGSGIAGAGEFLLGTGVEAWQGASKAASTIGGLGWPGALGALGGFGDVAVAGAGHVADGAWGGIQSIGSGIGHEASRLYGWLTGD
jgi:hypothetical protein